MSAAPLTDTSDMKYVHDAFRRAFGDASSQASSIKDGDTERAAQLADYLAEALWLLHAHHEAEDELLYPLLVERAPQLKDLFSRMETQHAAVGLRIQATQETAGRFGKSGSSNDAAALATACRSLFEEVAGHLTEEEAEVVPVAARTVTPEEWGALPAHALRSYSGARLWLPLGLATEMFPDDLRAQVFAHVPPPVSEMWFGFGSEAFTKEMAAIRGSAS
jgi:hemerythrin-like domain-containing protein